MEGPTTHKRTKRLESLVVGEDARVLNPAYSRAVRWLRLVLPMVAVSIVVMLITWTLLDRNTVVDKNADKNSLNEARNELVDARFESRDAEGNPFTVTAKRAVQGKSAADKKENTVYLEEPSGTMTMKDGNVINLNAAEGRYGQQAEVLDLGGDVTLTTSDGYIMKTARVFIEMKESTVKSNTPLQGRGPAGSVEALGFLADNEKGRIILKGPAKLVINPEAL